MRWFNNITKDRFFTTILLTVFGILSIGTVVSARSAKIAAEKTQTLIERSNRNSPILDLIKDCTTPGGQCYDRNAAQTGVAIQTITAQSACLIEETLRYQGLTGAELVEIKADCNKLLGGSALDLIRRAAK